MEFVAVAVVLGASVYAWMNMTALSRLTQRIPGPRERRLLVRRGFMGIGIWQLSVAGFLLTQEGTPFPVALMVMGLFFLFASRHPAVLGAYSYK